MRGAPRTGGTWQSQLQVISTVAHPPVRMKKWKGQAVHDSVGMVILVRRDLHPNRETVKAQIKVCTDRTLDADHTSNVLLAVIAVV